VTDSAVDDIPGTTRQKPSLSLFTKGIFELASIPSAEVLTTSASNLTPNLTFKLDWTGYASRITNTFRQFSWFGDATHLSTAASSALTPSMNAVSQYPLDEYDVESLPEHW
jgi:hypothetical protein